MNDNQFYELTNQVLIDYGFKQSGDGYYLLLEKMAIALAIEKNNNKFSFRFNVSINSLHKDDRMENGDIVNGYDMLNPAFVEINNEREFDATLLDESEWTDSFKNAIKSYFDDYKKDGLIHLKKQTSGNNQNKKIAFELNDNALDYLKVYSVSFVAKHNGQALAQQNNNLLMKITYISLAVVNIVAIVSICFKFFYGLLIYILPLATFLIAFLKLKFHKSEDKKIDTSSVNHTFTLRNNLLFKDEEPGVFSSDIKQIDATLKKKYIYFEYNKIPYIIENNGFICPTEKMEKTKEKFIKIFSKYYER